MKIESGLSEGQVLQRLGKKGADAVLKGTCPEKGPVIVSILKKLRPLPGWKNKTVGKVVSGKFSISLKNIPTGGPYRLEITAGKKKAAVKEFFVGDVWLLAGQSNMQGIGNMTDPAKPHPLIRSFCMRREWELAVEPLHVLRESPDACHNEGPQLTRQETHLFRKRSRKGAGVGIPFAREMLKRSGVPQGLICTAHGGTSMMQWNPDLKDEGGNSLYGSMLLSVRATGQPVAGMLWYQGESEANDAHQPAYTKRMIKLVDETRRDLHQRNLPWIIVQIARFTIDSPFASAWNAIQEQQRLLPDKIRNLETVAAIDLPLDDGIHIGALGFPRLGSRMARAADRLVYGNKREQRPPQLREIRYNYATPSSVGPLGPNVEVVYDNVTGGLKAGAAPQGFTFVTAEGTVWPNWFKTTLHGSTVRLDLDRHPPEGLKLHYGHGLFPACDITDNRDFSLPVFGPLPVTKREAYLPLVTQWRLTDLLTEGAPIETISCPDVNDANSITKAYPDGFVNEHGAWLHKNGQVHFATQMELTKSMKLEFVMNYDGPFRLWVDGKLLHQDFDRGYERLMGSGRKILTLTPGKHKVTVAMDINGGLAWGFALRFRRLDVSKAAIRANAYTGPSFSA